MNPLLFLVGSLLILVIAGMVFFRYALAGRADTKTGGSLLEVGRELAAREEDEAEEERAHEERLEQAELLLKRRSKKSGEPTLEEKLFMAGRWSIEDRRDFRQKQILAPIVLGVLGVGIGLLLGSAKSVLWFGLIGGLLGAYLPFKILDRWVAHRHEDISFFLPFVIEQISIGVSSSLDVGPCIAQIVQMADERKSHNSVTELLKQSQYYVRSGVGLEDALNEVGLASGQQELKHAFSNLARVAKYGGEISKQLNDLADSVASQREIRIDARVRKLDVKAAGPVSTIFLGYITILITGIFAEILRGFGSM